MTETDIVESIQKLPSRWHQSGTLNIAVVERIFQCAEGAQNTAETGCGKSTLALSHAAEHHLVFTLDLLPGEDPEMHSYSKVKQCPILKQDVCEFVLGPTQFTLPSYRFDRDFDLVLLDGPHGYPFPELEYYYFYPRLRQRGWLVIDDIQIPTIAHLVDFLKKDSMFSFEGVVRTTAFFRRTDAPTFSPVGDGWWEQGYNARRGVAIRHLGLAAMSRAIAQEALRRLRRR